MFRRGTLIALKVATVKIDPTYQEAYPSCIDNLKDVYMLRCRRNSGDRLVPEIGDNTLDVADCWLLVRKSCGST